MAVLRWSSDCTSVVYSKTLLGHSFLTAILLTAAYVVN